VTEYGPRGPIEPDFDRAQTEAWIQEDQQAQAQLDAEDARFAALRQAELEAELTEADWGI
jgi:hypothetical protein